MNKKTFYLLLLVLINCTCLFGQQAEQKYNEALSYYNAFTGDFQKALELSIEADMLVQKEGGGAELQWRILLLKHGVQEFLIMRPEQDKHTQRMVNFAEEQFGKPSAQYYEALTYRGVYLWNSIGDIERAKNIYEEALDWQIRNSDYSAAKITVVYLINLYSSLGDYSEVRKYYNQACELEVKLGAVDCSNQYINEYTLLKGERRYDEAGGLIVEQLKKLLNSAYLTAEQKRANSVYFYVYLVENFLEYYRYSGDKKYLDYVDSFGKEAATIFSEGYAQYYVPYFWQLYGHALVYMDKPQFAKQLYDGIFIAQTGILGQQNIPKTSYYKTAQARAFYETGALDYMQPILYEALELDKQQIQRDFPAYSEREKTITYEKFLRANLDLFAEYTVSDRTNVAKNSAVLYDQIIAVKGLLLQSQRKLKQQIESSPDKELKTLFVKWVDGKAFLSNAISTNQTNVKEFERITQEIELIEKELSNSEIGKKLFDISLSWKDIQSKLSDDEVAIEVLRFVKVDKRVGYLALILQKGENNPTVVEIENGAYLEDESILLYRDYIQYDDGSEEVFADFWADIQAAIPSDINRIFWSPDGVYNLINLNTIKGSNDEYLIDKYEIISVNHTRDLATVDQENEFNNAINLFGYPTYDLTAESNTQGTRRLDSLSRFFSGNEISILPGTKAEVESISSILNEVNDFKVEAYLNGQASESRIKSVTNPQILHIATHGYFLEDALGSNDRNNFTQHLKNPLFRSGLLLASAQNFLQDGLLFEQEDGLLTAFEVADMNLIGTELVTLSACETGLGEVQNGEGVYGLQRAFLLAGAERIINSLWLVDDQASKELMEYMYKDWVTTRDFRKSFRNAQLATRKKYPSPKDWGAFVMVEKRLN